MSYAIRTLVPRSSIMPLWPLRSATLADGHAVCAPELTAESPLGRRAAELLLLLRAKRSAEDVQAVLMPQTSAVEPSADARDVRSALFSGLSPEAAAELLTMCVLDVGAASFSYLLSTTER